MNKKKICFLGVMCLIAPSLIGCGGKKENSSVSEESSSLVSSLTDVSSGTSSNDDSSDPGENPLISQEKVVELILNSPYVDIEAAKTSKVTLTTLGYDGGTRYKQDMESNYTTYKDDLTIGKGSVKHVLYDEQGKEGSNFEDAFDEVRQLKDNFYTEAIDYENDVFVDKTNRLNLLLIDDVSNIESTVKDARAMVSCGAGTKLSEDITYALQIGGELFYTASLKSDGALNLTIYTEASNDQSNQQYVATFTCVFDSIEHGFLTNYVSEQAMYYLDQYNEATDISTLTPIDYSLESNDVTSGELDSFTGDLPIDFDSTFVKSIELSAATTTIQVGETLAISAKVLPETALNKTITFSSTNENVLVVRDDSTGTVEAVGEGTCDIVATNIESGVEGKITITVTPKPKPDAGEDSEKADLKNALEASLYQVLQENRSSTHSNWDESHTVQFLQSGTTLNSVSLSTIPLSSFAYNAKTKVATYVGDDIQDRIYKLLSFDDNGVENLSNYYGLNNRSVYYVAIEEFEIHLGVNNNIDYIRITFRNNSFDKTVSSETFATLTDENIISTLGNYTYNKWGAVYQYFESKGFNYPDE